MTVSVILIVAFAVLARVMTAWLRLEPWLDEAMLMTNLPFAHGAGLLAPLPFYDQASPVGYLLLAHLMAGWAPGHETLALRVLSALFSITGLVCLLGLLRTVRLQRLAPGVIVLACLSPFAVHYGVEIKHYQAEFVFTALLLWAGARLRLVPSARTGLQFFGASVFAMIFSFTAPLVIASVSVATVLGRLRAIRPRLLVVLSACSLSSVFAVGWYLGVTRPISRAQFAANDLLYATGYLQLPPTSALQAKAWFRLPRFLGEMLLPRYSSDWGSIVGAIVALLLGLGLWRLVRSSTFLVWCFIVLFGLLYILSFAHALPHFSARHFFFIIPLAAVVFAAGLEALLIVACWRRTGLVTPLFAALSVMLGTLSLVQIANARLPELRPTIAYYERNGQRDPLWVFAGAEPSIEILAPGLPRINRSRRDSMITTSQEEWQRQMATGMWDLDALRRGENVVSEHYKSSFRDDLRQHRSVWLLFSSISQQNLDMMIKVATETDLSCESVFHAGGALLMHCVRQKPS